MAGTHITITVDDAQVRDRLNQLEQADTSDLMPRLGEYLLKSTQKRFDKENQKAPDGTPWQALKARYASRKKYNKDKILTLRGYLRRSIRYQVVGSDAVEVGTNVEYAAIHQLGGAIQQNAQSRRMRFRSVAGRVLFAGAKHKRVTERWVTRDAYQVNMPARPFLGISADDEAGIQTIIAEWAAGPAGR